MKSHVVAAQLGQTERERQGVEAGVEVPHAARPPGPPGPSDGVRRSVAER